jgi:uncharacterized protein YgiM (DUF1202 family)
MLKRALICVLTLLALSGCVKPAGTTTPSAATPNATSGASASQVPGVFPSLPAVTPTSSASPTPFTPFTVKPAVDNLKIRVNPGLLFEAIMMVQQTDELTVLGTAPGNEWTYIQTATGTEGWVFSELLQSNVNLSQVPVREPKGVVVIKGRVLDAGSAPIQGVGFDVTQGGAGEVSTNSVVTDANGNFYAFMPDTASGSWTVSYTAIACKSNVWSDTACTTYKQGYTGSVDPLTQSVSLPQTGNPLLFTWR